MSDSFFAHPLGPFNPIHQYILSHAQPLTLTNWPYYFLLPIAPLGLQAYLLQFENTRKWRVAIAVGSLGLIGKTYSSYRFAEPYYNAFNAGITITYLHVFGKYIQFALPRHPIIDPYIAEGRSRIRAAVDLAFNSRMLGLGPTQIGGGPTINSKDVGATASNVGLDGEVKLAGQPTTRANRSRWLPYVNCGRTRLQATFRHAWRAYSHYVIMDFIRQLIQHFGATTIGSPKGGHNVVEHFIADNKFVFLPRLYRLPVPDWVVESAVVWCMSGGLWHGISWVYHFGAFITVGSGLWEPESWEVDMFDAPWKADSLMQLWGNRWHQLFRHHFLLLSAYILRVFSLPPNSPLAFPLIFVFSGAMHVIAAFNMSPAPATKPVMAFFLVAGSGAAAEFALKRITGRRVSGWPGRLWTWACLLISGRLAVRPWLDAGIGGSIVTPTSGPGRLGGVIVEWLAKWVIDTV